MAAVAEAVHEMVEVAKYLHAPMAVNSDEHANLVCVTDVVLTRTGYREGC